MLARSAGGSSAISVGPSSRRPLWSSRSCWYCERFPCSCAILETGSRKAASCSCRTASTAASRSGTSCIIRSPPVSSLPSSPSCASASAPSPALAGGAGGCELATSCLSCSITSSSALRRSSAAWRLLVRSSPHSLIRPRSSAVLRFSFRSSSK